MQDPNLLKASKQKMLIKKERVGSSQSGTSVHWLWGSLGARKNNCVIHFVFEMAGRSSSSLPECVTYCLPLGL